MFIESIFIEKSNRNKELDVGFLLKTVIVLLRSHSKISTVQISQSNLCLSTLNICV